VSAPSVPRLLRLGGEITGAPWAAGLNDQALLNEAVRVNEPVRFNGAACPAGAAQLDGAAGLVGDKAARLALAAGAGLAVLPGWMAPVAEGRPALSAGAAAVRQGRPAAARRAVLGHQLDEGLAAELREAVVRLGGRVIVRSSSPLESDPRWSGAFSSVAEVGPGDVVAAVRSCWASAFAVDPLGRLEACGLPSEALELGVLLQPEISPVAGGVAWVTRTGDAGAVEITVEGVPGHPGPLLSGWAEGASACVRLPVSSRGAGRLPPQRGRWPFSQRGVRLRGQPGEGGLAGQIGPETVTAVAVLTGRVWLLLGDDAIEWAADGGGVWLLQSRRLAATTTKDVTEGVTAAQAAEGAAAAGLTAGRTRTGRAGTGHVAAGRPGGDADGGLPTSHARMPLLAAAVLGRGEHVPGRPGAPGIAAGRLVACRPHERPAGDCGDAILLVDQPVPALAPLLFAARGVIARGGAAGSHLAEVARSLSVPMVLGCRPEQVTGGPPVPDGAFLAAIDGSTGDVALLPATGG
jgi:hypothetical protein